jgi:hypothetical protein
LLNNGYTFLLDDLKNCDPNNIVNIENAEIKMDADCNLVMSASGSSTEGFQNAEGNYTITNSERGDKSEGQSDFCQSKKSDNIFLKLAKMFITLNQSCPIPPDSVENIKYEANVKKFKYFFPLVSGKTNVTVNINHGEGVGNTCLAVTFSLTKDDS